MNDIHLRDIRYLIPIKNIQRYKIQMKELKEERGDLSKREKIRVQLNYAGLLIYSAGKIGVYGTGIVKGLEKLFG